MTDLQKKLLELLCEIDEICQKHHINYALFAGTGLGAERHHGFIPWDDDADIIMTLENYEKFLKVAPKELKTGRALNCLELGPEGYFFTYARYVDLDTTAIQRHTAFGGCDPGIKIDIFCAVPTYASVEKAERHRTEILAFAETICNYGVMYSFRGQAFHELFEKERQLMSRLGRDRYIKKRLMQLKKRHIRKPKRYVLFSGMMSDSYLIDAEIMENIKYVPFEQTTLPVSAQNVAFSKLLYGEGWMHLPKNIEKPRHTMLLDMEVPFSKYMTVLGETLDMEEKGKLAYSRRQIHLTEREAHIDAQIHREKLKNLAVEMQVVKGYEQLSSLEKEDWDLLFKIFQPYYEAQLSLTNRFFGIAISLPKEVFKVAMFTAIVKGSYDVALSILRIVARDCFVDVELYQNLKDKGDFCAKLNTAMFVERNTTVVKELLNEITDETLAVCFTVAFAKLWLCMVDEASTVREDALLNRIEEQLTQFPNAGEFMVLKGYCLQRMGKVEEAEAVYAAAVKNMKNAIIFQKLLDGGYTPYEES